MAIINNGKTSIKNDMAEMFDTVQQQRVQVIDELRQVNLAARSLYTMEAARMAAKHGADDVRAQAMAARQQNRLELINALGVEAQIAEVRTPVVDRQNALIHGRIVDAAQIGVAGADVQLVDESGADLGAPVVKTDASGYYAVELTPNVAAAIGERKIYLSVAGEHGKVTPAGEQGLVLASGEKVIREVQLNANEVAIVRGTVEVATPAKPTTRAATGKAKNDKPIKPATKTNTTTKKPTK